jgi:hypothetical protein
VVRHRADLTVGIFIHHDISCSESREERRPVAIDAEEDKTRRDTAWIQRPFARLGDTSGADDAGQDGEAFGKPAGMTMILCQPVDHPVRAIRERDKTRRCDDSCLAHPPAKELARAPRTSDERPVPNNE